jgi:hypothetical protein
VTITLDPIFLLKFALALGFMLAIFVGGGLAIDPLLKWLRKQVSDE